jgi:pyruvate/2-oxoglutarate dehydrogenase complex dihydrolipoamide acyltransferase (E2) component
MVSLGKFWFVNSNIYSVFKVTLTLRPKQLQDGAKNVPVGKIIALLAEEGDDISNLQPPKEEKPAPKQAATSSSTPPSEPPKPAPETSVPSPPPQSHPSTPLFHSRPLFPSVHRLLLEFGVTEPESIKGTGVRGMLTKGDVLAYLGKASGPLGTYKESPKPHSEAAKEKKEEYKVLGQFSDSHPTVHLTLSA